MRFSSLRHPVVATLTTLFATLSQIEEDSCTIEDGDPAVTRIELTVYADNTRAIMLYEKFGFEREGLFRQFALRDGRYIDAYCMARRYTLDTPSWAVRNQGFYEKLGYVKVGETIYPDITLFAYEKR